MFFVEYNSIIMCFNFANVVTAQGLEKRFTATFPDGTKYDPTYHANAFNKPEMPVITDKEPETINLYRWGLVPFWAKDENAAEDISTKTMNAREDTIFEKASFKNSIRKKRCLIPATGFYEWMHYKNQAFPHYIYLKNSDIFTFAGIWSSWTNKSTGEILNTFSIITTDANPMMAKIHNKKKRMPVILKQENEKDWIYPDLKENEIKELMKPYDDNEMEAYTISKLITDRTRSSNVKDVLEKFEYDELVSLFN